MWAITQSAPFRQDPENTEITGLFFQALALDQRPNPMVKRAMQAVLTEAGDQCEGHMDALACLQRFEAPMYITRNDLKFLLSAGALNSMDQ